MFRISFDSLATIIAKIYTRPLSDEIFCKGLWHWKIHFGASIFFNLDVSPNGLWIASTD
jgi:hypothetical protein